MRLCAHPQPAHIRMTRRRSVLPLPSSSISEEENYGCPEDNGNDNEWLEGLDKGRSMTAAKLRSSPGFVCFIDEMDSSRDSIGIDVTIMPGPALRP